MKKPIELETAKLANKKRCYVSSSFAYIRGELKDLKKTASKALMWHAPFQPDMVDELRSKFNIHISTHYSMYEQDGKLHCEHSALISDYNTIESKDEFIDIITYRPKFTHVKSFVSYEDVVERAIVEGLKMIKVD
jgi:hypothetical protein